MEINYYANPLQNLLRRDTQYVHLSSEGEVEQINTVKKSLKHTRY